MCFEGILAQTALGANPVLRDLLPGGAGGYAVIRIADFGIINVAADANVLLHVHFSFPNLGCPAGSTGKMDMTVDVVFAETVIPGAAGTVTEFQLRVIGVGTAANGALVNIRQPSFSTPLML